MNDLINGGGQHSEDVFERLLEAMPRIAEAVNAFSSEKNQRAALTALVAAIGIAPKIKASVAPTNNQTLATTAQAAVVDLDGPVDRSLDEAKVSTGEPSQAGGRPTRRRRGARKWDPVRDIDFHPEGLQSLPDFAAEKDPTNADQRNLIAVFWLEQIGSIEGIGVGQVLAAYKACGWPEPARADNALQVTASRNSWIDTKDMTAITTTPIGRNTAQFKMPVKKEK